MLSFAPPGRFEPEEAMLGTVVKREKSIEERTDYELQARALCCYSWGEPRGASDVIVHRFGGRLLGSGIMTCATAFSFR